MYVRQIEKNLLSILGQGIVLIFGKAQHRIFYFLRLDETKTKHLSQLEHQKIFQYGYQQGLQTFALHQI